MLELLKNFYNQVEELKGKKLLITLGIVFVVFSLIGVLIGSITNSRLKKYEEIGFEDSQETAVQEEYYEGKIEYVNPEFYPQDNVSFSLVDSDGRETILLKARDDKLSIAEGLWVKVVGKKSKLKDGKTDVLMVNEVIISQ